MICKLQFILVALLSFAGFGSAAQPGQEARTERIRARMEKAFGGKEKLSQMEYITYTISRRSFANLDTIHTTQLWYIHLKKPSVIKLDISGADTVISKCHTAENSGGSPACAALLRARFYNFLYLLTSPTVQFSWLKKTTYKGMKVDIIRVSEKSSPELRLDIFVKGNGEIATTSTIAATTGKYERFADEFEYVELEGGIRFPLRYAVFAEGKITTEGWFSGISTNRHKAEWQQFIDHLPAETDTAPGANF